MTAPTAGQVWALEDAFFVLLEVILLLLRPTDERSPPHRESSWWCLVLFSNSPLDRVGSIQAWDHPSLSAARRIT